jgi:integrase
VSGSVTGGQRVEQLARLTFADYDRDTQTIHLRDPKGRRTIARDHFIPLVPAAHAALLAMDGGAAGPHLFTFTRGVKPATPAALAKHLRRVVDAMEAAGELEKGRFAAGDLRRTVETRLGDLGVSSDTRAQLLSHGLGGVQVKHYDRNNYLAEKRAALETLHRLVTDTGAKVTPIKRAKA